MRPLRLDLTAFGSFAESESIEFAPLAALGLFLVTGPTGSGKTTIFDAMAFALYGKVPGDRPADVRSHHATDGVDTEVALEFEVDEGRFRVWRRPAFERPLRRGSGTRVVPMEAQLAMWCDGRWHGVLSQPSRVTERCIELIGLDAEQFQRVVLLPQGRFAQFLLADTAQRQGLLRQLFGSARYLAATDWYQCEARRLADEVADSDERIRHLTANARAALADTSGALDTWDTVGAVDVLDALGVVGTVGVVEALPTPHAPDGLIDLPALEAMLAEGEPHRARCRERAAALADEADRLTRVAARAEDLALRFDRAVAVRDERDALLAERDEIDDWDRRVGRASAARPVVVAAARLDQAVLDHERAAAAEQRARQVVAEAAVAVEVPLASVATPALAAAAFADRRGAVLFTLSLLDSLEQAAAAWRQAERSVLDGTAAVEAATLRESTAREAAAEAERELAVVLAQADALEALASAARGSSQVLASRRRLDALVVEASHAQTVAIDAAADEQAVLEQFVRGVAPRLAAKLRVGEPCSVCGAVEHPAPATHITDEVVELRHVTAAREHTEVAREAVARAVAELAALRGELGDAAALPLTELITRERAAAAGLDHARRTVARRGKVERTRSTCATELIAAGERRQQSVLDRERALTRQIDAVDELRRAEREAAHLDVDRVRRNAERLATTGRAVDLWSQAIDRLAAATGARSAAQIACDGDLSASGFHDVDAARSASMATSSVADARARVDAWRQRWAAVEAALAELDDAHGAHELVDRAAPASPPSVVRPDVRAARHAAEVHAAAALAAARELAEIEQRVGDVELALASLRREQADSAAVRDSYVTAQRVAEVCAGHIGRRTTLETWVLAAELDRVTEAATVHLQRMTGGRYTVRRGTDAATGNRRSGLDLVMLDAHTGRERTPATLSGGERFQASLALALGLADVISHGGSASGRVFDALFVDEGFGSLDPDALDDAIAALQQLQATGRMVGIITHVEAMQQQLPAGIDVRRRLDGRGSTLTSGAEARGAVESNEVLA